MSFRPFWFFNSSKKPHNFEVSSRSCVFTDLADGSKADRAGGSPPLTKSASIRTMVLVAVLVTIAGCSQSDTIFSEGVAVAPDSPEITFENYRDRKIIIEVPPGNRNPKISWETLNTFPTMPRKTYQKFANYSTAELKVELDSRFTAALKAIASDPQTLVEIRKAAQLYGIDPALIVGNVIGEHVYNTKLVMLGQDAAMRAVMDSWVSQWALIFEKNGILLRQLLTEAPFGVCESKKRLASDYWDCVNGVYENQYRRKVVDGRDFGDDSLKFTFFDPIQSGLTYGLGQLDPVRALMVTDRVNRISGFPLVSIDNPRGVYEAILNPRTAVHYIAANIVLSLEVYRNIAGFDISRNIGVVATLYNLGREKHFATLRYRDTLKSLKANQQREDPVESYYGFFINEKEQQIREFTASGRIQ